MYLQPQPSPVSETRPSRSRAGDLPVDRWTICPHSAPSSESISQASSECMPSPKFRTQRCCSSAGQRSREALARRQWRKRKVEIPGRPAMSNLMPCRRNPNPMMMMMSNQMMMLCIAMRVPAKGQRREKLKTKKKKSRYAYRQRKLYKVLAVGDHVS